MSFDVMNAIRDSCLYRGGEFMVLMAMADCANTADGDGIFPGVDLLAANARQSVRQCQENIKRLRADRVVIQLGPDGEDLEPDVNAIGGRGHRTEYRIDLERVRELQALHEDEVKAGTEKCDFCRAREERERRRRKRVQFSARKGEVSSTKGAVSDVKGEVSRSHIEEPIEPSTEPSIEPSERAAHAAASQSAFPGFEPVEDGFDVPPFLRADSAAQPRRAKTARHSERSELDAAYDAYNAAAQRTGWALCQRRSPLRDGHLRRRLKEAGGLDGWNAFLANAEADDWCCGRVPPKDGRQPFFAHIDYLLREQVFTKLMETEHGDRSRAATTGAGGVLASAARVAARRAAGGAH